MLLLSSSSIAGAQTFSQIMSFADQKVQEGDYYYAMQYYKQAMNIDSNSVEVLWKYAEVLRLYKDFPKAEFYYQKVYKKEDAKIYPKSIFWLATMQHYNGKYKEAIQNWKKAKKRYKRDRDSYEYLKSLHEMKSCLWASKAIRDTSKHIVHALDEPVNTVNAEFAPVIFKNKLYYTSLKADSINFIEEVFTEEYSLQIYSADQEDSIFNNVQRLKSVMKTGWNSANGSFSPDGKRFYFSRCNSAYDCKIYVAKVDGDKIYDIDSLGEIINEPGYISTMPHCTMIDGQEVLFFSSTIIKNFGGFDIWYSKITNGNQYSLPKNITSINTMDDEISPFYDTIEHKLYFSSNWHSGFGGQDIFWVKNNNWEFKDPINAGLPINSNKNDTYFIIDQENEKYYFSSNRDGVKFAKNPNCCNDIFSAYLPVVKPPTRFETLNELNKKLPVILYFHNDEPNPRTRDTVSTLTYIESYNAYEGMKKKYKKEYSHGLNGEDAEEAKEDIEDFFIEYVEQGVIDLKEFLRLLILELDKGYEIEITIKGFASPLAKTDYNVPLTKRRISSLLSYLQEFDNGLLEKYMTDQVAENGGHLTFVKIPFGEYTADQLISDNPNDAQNSVYSRKAALERKIVIQSVSLITQDSSYAKMKFGKQAHDFGASTKGSILTYEFTFINNGDETLEIGEISGDCDCLSFDLTKSVFEPGESGKILISWDTSKRSGITYSHLTVKSNIKGGIKQLTLTSEIK